MSLGYGNVARVGQLYPSGGISDYELQRMAPEGMQVITTRMPFRDTSKKSDYLMLKEVEQHAQLLADAKVDVITFNCTAVSLMVGPEKINDRIEAETGIKSITTIEAVLDALEKSGARRLGLFTPYLDEVVFEEKRFLNSFGYEIVSEAHIPCLDPVAQGSIPPGRWANIVKDADLSNCDALLFSCSGIQISPVLSEIEKMSGRTVISSNSALLRSVLGRLDLGVNIKGYGRLLEEGDD